MFRILEKKYFRLIMCMIGMLIFIFTSRTDCKSQGQVVRLDNGRVSMHIGPMKVSELLKLIVRETGVELFIVDAIIEDPLIRVRFEDVSLEELFESLLKNNSYAVVYNSGLSQMYFSNQAIAGQSQPAVAYPQDWDNVDTTGEQKSAFIVTSEENLLEKIRNLENRIHSGISDREYDRWASIRGPKYVVHDRDLLVDYIKKLEDLHPR